MFCKLKAYNDSKTEFGGLTIPPRCFVEYIMKLESIFESKFNDLVSRESIGQQLKKEFSNIMYVHPCPNFPLDYFLSLFTRVRIYFTLKFINSDIKTARINKTNSKLTILKHL